MPVFVNTGYAWKHLEVSLLKSFDKLFRYRQEPKFEPTSSTPGFSDFRRQHLWQGCLLKQDDEVYIQTHSFRSWEGLFLQSIYHRMLLFLMWSSKSHCLPQNNQAVSQPVSLILFPICCDLSWNHPWANYITYFNLYIIIYEIRKGKSPRWLS